MGVVFAGNATSAEAPDIEPGVYTARFDGVTPKAVEGDFSHIEKDEHGVDIPNAIQWDFTVAEEDGRFIDGESIEVSGLTSMNMNFRSNKAVLPRWLKALMTPAEYAGFEAGDKIDAEAIVGRTCQVIIEIKKTGWPKVTDVLPVQKPARKARTA